MRAAAAATLVLLAFAGCLGGGDNGNDPSPSSSPTSSGSSTMTTTAPPPGPVQTLDLLLAFEFLDCEGMAFQHNRPLEDVQALLPSGFTATTAPGPAAGTPTGVLGLDLYRCASLTTAAVAVPDTYVGLEYTYVERPLQRVAAAPEAPVQEYVFRLLAGEDALARLWPAAGYDTYNGSANVSVGPPLDGPDAGLRMGQASIGSEGYFLVATGAGLDALGGSRSQAFARYTVLGDASVLLWTGTYDLPSAASGPGTVLLPANDPFGRYATPGQPSLEGTVRFLDSGNVRAQDLRRLFT